MSRLLLVRHCASTGQEPGAALTEAGAAAAVTLASALAKLGPDAAYSSPYRRAMATLDPFARRNGLTLNLDTRLRERVLSKGSLDDWLDHVRRSYDDMDHCAPGGESLRQAQARGLAALADIAAAGHVLPVVASHGNLISAILRAADPAFGFADWQALRNPDVFEVVMRDGRPVEFVRLD